MLKRLFLAESYRIETAINAVEGLASVDQELPDLIFNDIPFSLMDSFGL